jgi:hypothetical protein
MFKNHQGNTPRRLAQRHRQKKLPAKVSTWAMGSQRCAEAAAARPGAQQRAQPPLRSPKPCAGQLPAPTRGGSARARTCLTASRRPGCTDSEGGADAAFRDAGTRLLGSPCRGTGANAGGLRRGLGGGLGGRGALLPLPSPPAARAVIGAAATARLTACRLCARTDRPGTRARMPRRQGAGRARAPSVAHARARACVMPYRRRGGGVAGFRSDVAAPLTWRVRVYPRRVCTPHIAQCQLSACDFQQAKRRERRLPWPARAAATGASCEASIAAAAGPAARARARSRFALGC